jgi:light-regulated signal transduction histidine kinase (bacteriophytochrome)
VNAAKMGMLIDDILDYSRAGRLPLERTAVDIGKLATKIAGELRGNYPHTEIAIGDLPVVLGDATMLRQVFQNLIENACKFSAKQEHPRVEIEATRRGDMVECVIRDNGVGFDPRYAGKMFGMFQRMHLEVDFPGTGVGLAIVDRLISRHGGTIRAESHPGKGATFTFTLLLAD